LSTDAHIDEHMISLRDNSDKRRYNMEINRLKQLAVLWPLYTTAHICGLQSVAFERLQTSSGVVVT